jgi:hypothetical protein
VAEDAADLRDVEPEVDDQVAGECMAQVVKARRRGDASGRCGARWSARLSTLRCPSGVPLLVVKT